MKNLSSTSTNTYKRISATVMTVVLSAIFAINMWGACGQSGFKAEQEEGHAFYVQFGNNEVGGKSVNGHWGQNVGQYTFESSQDLYLWRFSGKLYGGAYKIHFKYSHNNKDFSEYNAEKVDGCNDKTVESNSISGVRLIQVSNPGEYYVYYYFQAEKYNDAGDWGWTEGRSHEYCNNRGMNYSIKMTVPGFSTNTADVMYCDFGEVTRGSDKDLPVSYQHYGGKQMTVSFVKNGTSDSDLATLVGEGYTRIDDTSNSPKFTVSEITNTGLKINFDVNNTNLTPGSKYCAKVVLNEPYNKGNKAIVIKGIVGQPYPQAARTFDPELLYGPQVKLFGFVRLTGCNTIDDAGFVVIPSGGSDPAIDESTGAITSGAQKYSIPGNYNVGDDFEKTITKFNNANLVQGGTYKYIAYVHSSSAVNGKSWFSSDVGTFTVKTKCSFAVGDTVYYTIDNTQEANLCELRFPSLAEAVADMKNPPHSSHPVWLNSNNILLKPVVFEVVKGKAAYGNSDNATRETCLVSINTTSMPCDAQGYDKDTYIADMYAPTPTQPGEKLIIRAKKASEKPTFKGGLDLQRARNITLKNLIITRETNESSHEGSALEFGFYLPSDNCHANFYANSCTPGKFANANIEVLGCEVTATAFNCVHAAGCDKLKLDECVFYMTKPSYTGPAETNSQYWGASVKLMSCKNVQFTRNSLKGSHATTLFLQHTQNMLIMNNVFWNDNKYSDNVAFIRPIAVSFGGEKKCSNNQQDWDPTTTTASDLKNIGVYYNTFYLADHDANNSGSGYPVDFLRFGGPAAASQNGCTGNYKPLTIEFKWNNCYSYDDQINSRNNDATAFLNVANATYGCSENNFWSKGDANPDSEAEMSGLAFGTSTHHVNVPDQLCGSTANNPDGLVVKGNGLNLGSKPSSDISQLSIANTTYSDRLSEEIRPAATSGWTYGAYQKKGFKDEVDVIVWTGKHSGDWDNRRNWISLKGDTINCTHSFSNNLKVIIPNIDGDNHTPEILAWGQHMASEGHYYTENPRGQFPDEYVEAGRDAIVVGEKENDFQYYAKEIELRDGASIKGVENLHGDNSGATARYSQVHNIFKVPRSIWVLVGSMIKPVWQNGGDVQSGDFYLDGAPQVYMRKAEIASNGSAVWRYPFGDMFKPVHANEAFAIRIPNAYGKYYGTDVEYYANEGKNVPEEKRIMATDSIKYDFWGRFHDDTSLPVYSSLTAGANNLVNNSYPANIRVGNLKTNASADVESVQIYDSDDLSFAAATDNSIIHPQQGFIIKTKSGKTSVSMTSNMYVSGSAKAVYEKDKRLKSSEVELPYCVVRVGNTTEAGGSRVIVNYDDLKEDAYVGGPDVGKIFNDMEVNVPELYVTEYGQKLAAVTLPTLDRVVPLGLRLRKQMVVRFELKEDSGLDRIELVDNLTEHTTDLASGEVYTISLPAGTYEGRFFLNLGAKSEDHGDITTVEYAADDVPDNNVFIFSNDNNVVISSVANTELLTAYITDMAGKTTVVELPNAHYNILQLSGQQGVYVIKAVGNNSSRTEKVILKGN